MRKLYSAPPYGWSQDAIDGALLALIASGRVEARHNGAVVGPKQIAQNQLGVVEFRSQVVVPTMQHRLDVRNLALSLGAKLQGVDDLELPRLIAARLHELANGAGADAPMPARPAVDRIRDLEALAGNEQFVALADAEARARAAHCRVEGACGEDPAPPRTMGAGSRAIAARDRSAGGRVSRAQIDAVAENRLALKDPDPLAPILSQVTEVLRAAVAERWGAYDTARSAALNALDKSKDWKKVERTRAEPALGPGRPR